MLKLYKLPKNSTRFSILGVNIPDGNGLRDLLSLVSNDSIVSVISLDSYSVCVKFLDKTRTELKIEIPQVIPYEL